MLHRSTRRRATGLTLALLASVLAALTVLVGPSSGASERALATITVDTLPIANGFPLDVGIQKGFFEKRGIEIKQVTVQSGNDIILALANNNGDIGYIGWTPAFIAATSGLDIVTAAASETEATFPPSPAGTARAPCTSTCPGRPRPLSAGPSARPG